MTSTVATHLKPKSGRADRSIIRIGPVIDDARVVHHIVLYETEGEVENQRVSDCGAGLGRCLCLGTGQPALHFNEGGLILEKDKIMSLRSIIIIKRDMMM